MDNFQRTEHFLSYCPELIGVTESTPSKEAIKRLSKFLLITKNIDIKNFLFRKSRKDIHVQKPEQDEHKRLFQVFI